MLIFNGGCINCSLSNYFFTGDNPFSIDLNLNKAKNSLTSVTIFRHSALLYCSIDYEPYFSAEDAQRTI
jgi:hypothetical protein